jgi:hypothetical protein
MARGLQKEADSSQLLRKTDYCPQLVVKFGYELP